MRVLPVKLRQASNFTNSPFPPECRPPGAFGFSRSTLQRGEEKRNPPRAHWFHGRVERIAGGKQNPHLRGDLPRILHELMAAPARQEARDRQRDFRMLLGVPAIELAAHAIVLDQNIPCRARPTSAQPRCRHRSGTSRSSEIRMSGSQSRSQGHPPRKVSGVRVRKNNLSVKSAKSSAFEGLPPREANGETTYRAAHAMSSRRRDTDRLSSRGCEARRGV